MCVSPAIIASAILKNLANLSLLYTIDRVEDIRRHSQNTNH
jgi:hypothetical protein